MARLGGPKALARPAAQSYLPLVLSEASALAILRSQLERTYAESHNGRVRRGIGDDAAVLALDRQQVWTMDACAEGSHFLRDWVTAEDVAHKALQAALSDVPAMGATPRALLCHLTLPDWVTSRWLRRFAAEQARIALDAGAAVVGGNVSPGAAFQVVTSVLGETRRSPLRQSGARPGDELWLIGSVGLARAGLRLLKQGVRRSTDPAIARCLLAFRRPRAQLTAGRRLVGRATACLDVSDGLEADVRHLAEQSDVKVVLGRGLFERVISLELHQLQSRLGESAFELAWRGGEDYALLASGPSVARPSGARTIGWVEPGRGVAFSSERSK